MPEYDAIHYSPAAPVASASLRHPQSGTILPSVFLLLDSGAEITLLPQALVEQLGIPSDTAPRYEVMGFDGNRSSAPAADLDLILLGKVFRGRYLLLNQEHGILGRDILNHLAVLLDGPRRQWTTPG
jgi:hypothetical protein